MDVAFFDTDTIQESTARVPISQNMSRSNDRCGPSRRRKVLHPGEGTAEFVVLSECYDRAGSVRASPAQAIRVHIRGLRGETKSTEGPSAAVHSEEATTWQSLPLAGHSAAEGPVLVLSAAGCTHTTFLHRVIRMIPIKRTVRPMR